VVAVAEFYSFREDWHRDDRVKPLIRQYHLAMDAALRVRPDLQGCAVRCCHCGIRFFAHPRNAGRENLRCPFGCRQHHRRQCGNARSRKYYRTDRGRKNKKLHNCKRSRFWRGSRCDVGAQAARLGQTTAERSSDSATVKLTCVEPARQSAAETLKPAAPTLNLALPLDGLVLDEVTVVNSLVLPYAQMVATVIEGRTISRDELIAALRKRMRQRSIDWLPRREYVLHYLTQHPP